MTDATYSRLADPEWTPYQRRYWGKRLPNSVPEPVIEAEPEPDPKAGPPRRITVAEITRACAGFAGVTVFELKAPGRKYRLCHPRQAAMYLAAKYTSRGTIDIGRRLGGRDHSTVHHARYRVQADLDAGGKIFGPIVKYVEASFGLGKTCEQPRK